MLHFRLEQDRVVEISSNHSDCSSPSWVDRHDFHTFDDAWKIAEQASDLTGDLYIATNRPNSRPQFDVVKAPKIGDDVSYSYNGDTMPCGTITKVSKTLKKVTTSSGRTFIRVKDTGTWLSDRMWSMVGGHINTRNPHF